MNSTKGEKSIDKPHVVRNLHLLTVLFIQNSILQLKCEK